MSRSKRVMRALTYVPLLMLFVGVAPLGAQMLAFDFDTDEDPSTVENEVIAEVGSIVRAFLVVQSMPVDHPWLHGVQFGLAASSGLEFLGMSAVDGALYIQDGLEGISVAFLEYQLIPEDPVFVMSFAFRVDDPGVQTVEVIAGYGHVERGFEFVGSSSADGAGTRAFYSQLALTTQRAAVVNRTLTPIEETSWGAIKELYAEEVGR